MKVNDEGLALLKDFEKCRLEAYQDGGGVWTVGYGSTGPHVFKGLKITQDAANRLLEKDLERFEASVDRACKIPVGSNQFSAMVCLAFNIGVNAFEKSTLLKKVNACDFEGAAEEFARWNRDNGKVVAGLTRRRSAEKALFLK